MIFLLAWLFREWLTKLVAVVHFSGICKSSSYLFSQLNGYGDFLVEPVREDERNDANLVMIVVT